MSGEDRRARPRTQSGQRYTERGFECITRVGRHALVQMLLSPTNRRAGRGGCAARYAAMHVERLVFLDIDGVLAHVGSHERLDPSCLRELDWLVARTGARLVLTSSWRDAFGLDETQRRLAHAGLVAPITAATPCIRSGTRSDEIDAYLATCDGAVRFVILDDVPVAAHLRRYAVLIDDFVGLTGVDTSLAARLLLCPRGPA